MTWATIFVLVFVGFMNGVLALEYNSIFNFIVAFLCFGVAGFNFSLVV